MGSSITVVNDLTTGGTASALSAQQGKLLNSRPGQFVASKFRAGIEKAMAGTTPLLIALPGDSTTSGAGAGTGATGLVNAQPWCVGSQLARVLDRTFMYTTCDSFFGDQNVGGGSITPQQFDPRFGTFGAGWTVFGTPSTIGGRMFIGADGGAGEFAFTPTRQWNTVRILFLSTTTTATAVSVKAGGTTFATQSTRAASGVITDVTLSTGAAAAVQKFSLDTVTGGSCQVIGAIFWDSANPGCVVCPLGWWGSNISNLNTSTNAGSYRPASVTLGAHLYIVNETINDQVAGLAVGTYQTALQGYVSAIAAVGDVLIVGNEPASGATTNNLFDVYKTAMDTVAASVNSPCKVVDWRDEFGYTYAAANAAGWMFDVSHLKGIGYARQANVYAERIRRIALFDGSVA